MMRATDANRPGPELPRQLRTAVCQAVGAFGLIPGDPRAHHSRTDARGGGDGVHPEVVVERASDRFGSTRGGGSGILMGVHSVHWDEALTLLTTSAPVRIEWTAC